MNEMPNSPEAWLQSFSSMMQAGVSDQDESAGSSAAFGFSPDKILKQIADLSKNNTQSLFAEQSAIMQQQVALWQSTSTALANKTRLPVLIEEEASDRRFRDAQWNENPLYSYIKQSYLLNSKLLQNLVDNLQYEDEDDAMKASFMVRQYLNAIAPTNNALTNPEVQALTLKTQGKNLVDGMENFTRDAQRSPPEILKVTQCLPNAFKLGENIATTPGKVIYQNEVMQLIQYTPTTEKVYSVPVLIIPPFINKYYILDLSENNSYVRWLVGEGFTVFMVSWVNPDSSLAGVGFEDYVLKGVVEAADVVSSVCRTKRINAVGYCSGGTMLSVAQALLRARDDKRFVSCTLIATQTDFSDPGGLGVYLSDKLIPFLEQHTNMKGIFDGRALATGFNLLRENSLYWSYFVDNYLKGKQPKAFDILHWNGDSANIPAKTMSFYLRKMYMENSLAEPDALTIDGENIDVSKIDTPSYFVAMVGDHIVPCTASFRSSQYFGGSVRFVLGESGHIAGVVNPVAEGKYNHWVNDKPSPDFETWKKSAAEVEGSWWTDWVAWLAPMAGKEIAARKIGNTKYKPIEDAPGSYVKVCI